MKLKLLKVLKRRFSKEIGLLRKYTHEVEKARKPDLDAFEWARAIRYLPRWRYLLAKRELGYSTIDDGEPWICVPARDFLCEYLSSEMCVFEYGSGGSTLFFADRVNRVVSVEHDPWWAMQVRRHIAESGIHNVTLYVQEGSAEDAFDRHPSRPENFVSGYKDYLGWTFEEYVRTIDRYEDGSFDLVVVDGRARPSCLIHAIPKVRLGGLILLDNCDRTRYQSAQEQLASMLCCEFCGPVPYLKRFTRAKVWEKTG